MVANLPEVSRRNVTTRAARSSLSSAEIMAPYNSFAEAAENFGDAAGALHDTAERGLLAEEKTMADRKIGELSRQFADNPDDFDTATSEYLSSREAALPSTRTATAAREYIGSIATRQGEQLRDQKFTRTVKTSNEALSARLEATAMRAASLAREGGVGTPEFKMAQREIFDIRQALVDSPLSTYSRQQAALDNTGTVDGLVTESMLGGIERIFDKSVGDPAARAVEARAYVEEIVKTGGFGDGPAAKKKADAVIRSLQAEGRDAQREVRDKIEAATEEVRSDPSFANEPALDELYEEGRRFGLDREAGVLRKARDTARVNGNTLMDPKVRRSVTRGNGINVSRETDAAGLIAEFEGFRDRPYFDVNALRTGFGSDTVTRADGKVEKVAEGTRVTRDEAKLDLDRRIGEYQAGIIKDVGADKWEGLPEGAKAALSSVAYNYGRLPTVVAGAVATGDINKIADAVEGLKDQNEGVNAGRRMQEAAIIRGAPLGTLVHSEASDEVVKAAKAQQKIIDDDPLRVWNMTRAPGQEGQRFGDIDFANPESIGGEVQKRIAGARFVRNLEGLAEVPAFQEADAEAFAAAVGGGNPQAAGQAMASLAALPDDVLMPTVGMTKVKSALQGAARSTDPAQYRQAMSYIEQMWARAPQDVQHTLGDGVVKEMQDYQAAARYYSDEELADRLKRRNDPAIMKRQEVLRDTGEKEARKKSVTELVDEFGSWLAIDPSAPESVEARDALMGDYISIYGERFAATESPTEAHRQTVERLRTVWKKSDVNGGRLTMYAPENFYDPVAGSHDWMAQQLEADLEAQLGAKPEAYELIPDRQTRADADAGRAPSYFVVATRPDGRKDFVRGADGSRFRYAWDRAKPAEEATARFDRQRRWVMNGEAMPDATIRERLSMVGENVKRMARGEETRNVLGIGER